MWLICPHGYPAILSSATIFSPARCRRCGTEVKLERERGRWRYQEEVKEAERWKEEKEGGEWQTVTAGGLILCRPTSDGVTLHWSWGNFIGHERIFFCLCLFGNFVTCKHITQKIGMECTGGEFNANKLVQFGLISYTWASNSSASIR